MKTPQIPPLKGMSPLGAKPASELFEAPFNLAGELIDNSTTAEGEARVRALAEAEARKAQLVFGYSVGDKIRWTESDDEHGGLKSYCVGVIVKVEPARYKGAHTWYYIAGLDYPIRDDLVRNAY